MAVGVQNRIRDTPASSNSKDDPIRDLKDVKPNVNIFEHATRDNPLVIRSQAVAEKHFSKDELAKLLQQVNFEKQLVLVFAWRGSGQDQFSYSVAESFPEQIYFQYKPGLSRDLKPHIYVFVLRSNVRWQPPKPPPGVHPAATEYIKVDVRGKLNSQIMAIGGETTGVNITATGVTWELDFGANQDLRRKAKLMHNKTVTVQGKLTVKRGVEIARRWIVRVETLDGPGDKQ